MGALEDAVARVEASFAAEAQRVNADLAAANQKIADESAKIDQLTTELANAGVDPALVARLNKIADSLDAVDLPTVSPPAPAVP
jgi:hypothetical protein